MKNNNGSRHAQYNFVINDVIMLFIHNNFIMHWFIVADTNK